MDQVDWKTLIRPKNVVEFMEKEKRDAVWRAKVEAAYILAGEINRREAVTECLKKFVHYEPWMDGLGDDVQVSTFKRHTFGDLRRATEIINAETTFAPNLNDLSLALASLTEPKARDGSCGPASEGAT